MIIIILILIMMIVGQLKLAADPYGGPFAGAFGSKSPSPLAPWSFGLLVLWSPGPFLVRWPRGPLVKRREICNFVKVIMFYSVILICLQNWREL